MIVFPPTERMADAFEAARREFWDSYDIDEARREGIGVGELRRRANLAGLTAALAVAGQDPAVDSLRFQRDWARRSRTSWVMYARRMRAALKAVADPDPCSFDHHGSCQAHRQGADDVCPQKLVRDALDPAAQS